ncbi:hypothetical protein CAPTEDRAFT_117465 [Capitella teleta]|uniref:Small integral membrane protein 8 n=1 Tax=Capitella teleta TaxID=283909 RepID=R7UZL8_CAPTE|nr:hypothetical protein CAPTEDRAFT_117465 [Capitella teleta]|eukprot:ELU09412.1 hypothetical protein CAPTEDRAFT_117465 [Capitella teleta]
MSDSSKNTPPKERFREPGWRSLPSTSLFRAVNPELYIKPNMKVMAIGVALFSGCVAYLAYLNATTDNNKMYMSMDNQGKLQKQYKTSRWD